jgi:hypothetical protein
MANATASTNSLATTVVATPPVSPNLGPSRPSGPTSHLEPFVLEPITTPNQQAGIFKTIRSKLGILERVSAQLGWVFTLIFGIIAVLPSDPSKKLRDWTALKDFMEECRREAKAGFHRDKCDAALKKPLPPPPDINIKLLSERQGSWASGRQVIDSGWQPSPKFRDLLLGAFYLLWLEWLLFFLWSRRRRTFLVHSLSRIWRHLRGSLQLVFNHLGRTLQRNASGICKIIVVVAISVGWAKFIWNQDFDVETWKEIERQKFM